MCYVIPRLFEYTYCDMHVLFHREHVRIHTLRHSCVMSLQVLNFDVITLNESWLDTQNKYLLAEVVIHDYKVFHVDGPTPSGRGGGSIICQKTFDPIERKSSATCTRENYSC